MTDRPPSGEIHERAWELLPWLVNGTLEREAEPWLAEHVSACEDCRREINAQTRLQAGFVADARVEYAPQASFEKLTTRIREFEEDESAGNRAPARERPAPASLMPRWLPAALALQGVFVLTLAVIVGWQTYERMLAPSYRTLTEADAAVAAGANLRLVLAPATTLSDFEALVGKLRATVVAGPSSAHVWTLVVPYSADSPQFADLLHQLRADERVALAEPVAVERSRP